MLNNWRTKAWCYCDFCTQQRNSLPLIKMIYFPQMAPKMMVCDLSEKKEKEKRKSDDLFNGAFSTSKIYLFTWLWTLTMQMPMSSQLSASQSFSFEESNGSSFLLIWVISLSFSHTLSLLYICICVCIRTLILNYSYYDSLHHTEIYTCMPVVTYFQYHCRLDVLS